MKRVLLLVLLIVGLGLNSQASHNSGGEITYEWISGNTYKVRLILYTDCGAPPGGSLATLTANSSCTGVQNIPLTRISLKDISQTCDTMMSMCNGGMMPGNRESIYEGTAVFNACNDWVLSYSICCRNGSPINIVNPNSANFYIEASMDNSTITNNSSPYFVDRPRSMLPINQTNLINAGAYDPDGDSLFFSMVAPQSANGTPLTFMAGYSATEPFVSTPATSFDSQTGIITTTPTTVGGALISVKVEEFRNGQLIGSTIRDFSTNQYTDTNTLPAIINPILNFNTCAVDTLNFDLFSTDLTDSVTTTLLYPFNPGTAPYFTNATTPNKHTNYLNDTNNFYWDMNIMPNREYVVYVNAKDKRGTCINGIQSYGIIVSTSNCGGAPSCQVDIPQDTIFACQALAQLNAIPTGGQPPYAFSWSPTTGLSNPNIQNPTVSQAHYQQYVVTMLDGVGCLSYDTIIVSAYNPVMDTLSFCFPDSVELDFGPGATDYFWQNFTDTLGNNFTLTDTTQTIWASEPGQYFGFAVFPGCGALTSLFTVEDTCVPAPCISFDIATTPPSCPTCNDGTASVINLTGGCPPYTYLWNTVPPQSGPVITTGSGSYSVTVAEGGCCPPITKSTCLNCDSVWPGDANSDMIANVYDILPIGVYYNTTGTPRTGATNNWIAQWSQDWGATQGSGADLKHVDCDGDAVIDFNDVSPILSNYGLTHSKGNSGGGTEGINDPTLYVNMALDTVPTSTPLAVPVYFGTAAVPADSIYGIAMSITYDQNLIDSIAGISVDFSNSWLGTEGVDMITLDTNFYDNGQIDIGLVRTDGLMVNGGFGEILTLNIITIDNLSGKTILYETLPFDFMNVVIIDNEEGLRPFNQQMDSVIIEDLGTTGVEDVLEESVVQIVPNPNNGNFKVYINDFANSSIAIYNTMGQLMEISATKQQGYFSINLSSFEQGMYFVKVMNDNKATTIEKVVVQ